MPSSWNLLEDHATISGMSLRALLLPSGRLAPRPFTIAVIVLYAIIFASQMLLSSAVTARGGVWPFVAAQALLIWVWIVLHRRRMHDAGRPTGLVIGIALAYAVEIILIVAMAWLILASAANSSGEQVTVLHVFIFIYLLGLMSGDPHFGALTIWLYGFVVLLLVPIVAAFGLSLWAATRPSVPAAP
jgi:hypothetical protein